MTYLLTFAVAFVSAWVPFIPIEAYLLALLSRTSVTPGWMAIAAAAGQTTGKALIFLSARGIVRSERILRWRAKREHRNAARWGSWVTTKMDGKGGLPVVFLSAVVGMPPLLLLTVIAGGSRMSLTGFIAVTAVGRWIRFFLVLAAPGLLFGWP